LYLEDSELGLGFSEDLGEFIGSEVDGAALDLVDQHHELEEV